MKATLSLQKAMTQLDVMSHSQKTPPIALTIAGSDSIGGAGIQADLKTFAEMGVYGTCAITALTAQNTQGVTAVHTPEPDFLRAQIMAVHDDIRIDAIKIGMVANADNIIVIAECLNTIGCPNVVFDPVMVATSGASLFEGGNAIETMFPLLTQATLITPNLSEAATLLNQKQADTLEAMEKQATALYEKLNTAIMLKGGHGNRDETVDILVTPEGVSQLTAPRIKTDNTHGTGCTLSSAIAANLAKGSTLYEACNHAKHYVFSLLKKSQSIVLGKKNGPMFHLIEPQRHF
jgi:hydroxymethylpyrimidine/phosphomethylpyrimidine kinase